MVKESAMIDEGDKKLLALLQNAGRLPIVELARRANMSETTCLRRVRSLEAAGVITGYRAEIDQDLTGFAVTAFVQVSLDQRVEAATDTFKLAIEREPWVLECYSVAGSFDHLLKVVAPDNKALSRFILKELSTYESVRDFQTVFVLDTVKLDHTVPLSPERRIARPR